MTTLEDLINACSVEFPGKSLTYVKLFFAWTKSDLNDELSGYLTAGGLQLSQMSEILEHSLNRSDSQDKLLLEEMVKRSSGQPVLGWHLLNNLVQHEEHRLTMALVAAGLNLEEFKQALTDSEPDPPATGIWDRIDYEKPKHPNLSRFGRNLSERAKQGQFDDLHICQEDLERCADALRKKGRGNIALTGGAGIGKSCLVEGVALAMVRGHLSGSFANTEIWEIDVNSIVAGTKYRGEFEERIKLIVGEAKTSRKIILFIDELHLIVGAGRAEGSMDAANILKPALARGEIRLIGATTIEEFNRYIANDKALARRFEEVRLEEPSGEHLYNIVSEQSKALATHHKVLISAQVKKKAIEWTDKYVVNRYQPDKSIDLLDTTASRLARQQKKEITTNDLLETLAKNWKCPIALRDSRQRASLDSIFKRIQKKIKGQDVPVQRVVDALVYRFQGLGSDRNLGTFLFSGPTGVGKSELGRVIAEELFGDQKMLLHIDCPEYSTPISLTGLVGTPNGYVGCEREGTLPSFIRNRGQGVIILDEIEKASDELRKLLLGMLDNGRISSAKGELLNTRMCVVIATTNALSKEELSRTSFGFGNRKDKTDAFTLLERHFSPEFLSRFDELIIFDSLSPQTLREILKLRISEAFERLEQKGIYVNYDEARLVAWLEAELDSVNTGARGIARLLETKILQPLSAELLKRGEPPIHIQLNELMSLGEDALISHSEII